MEDHRTDDRLAYSPVELASKLGVSEEDVQWLIDTGQLSPVQIRGKSLILARDVELLLRAYQIVQKRGNEYGK